MVSPTGARASKSDHPALPVTPTEIARTARACQAAGAAALHLHVRAQGGTHSLDAGRYREAAAAVCDAAPGMAVQVTTEAAGIYAVSDQLDLLEDLKPGAASIAVREMARDEALAARAYAVAREAGTEVQHILYGEPCLRTLAAWFADGTVPETFRSAILVLGQYAPARAAAPHEVAPFVGTAREMDLVPMVCAFGPQEHACLLEAARLGADLRVGFENSLSGPDGMPWADNAASVAALVAALGERERECA